MISDQLLYFSYKFNFNASNMVSIFLLSFYMRRKQLLAVFLFYDYICRYVYICLMMSEHHPIPKINVIMAESLIGGEKRR